MAPQAEPVVAPIAQTRTVTRAVPAPETTSPVEASPIEEAVPAREADEEAQAAPEAPPDYPESAASDLEQALSIEEPNDAWAQEMQSTVEELVSIDPEVEVLETRCAQTFCRIHFRKPIESVLDWAQIDERLHQVIRGETMMRAVPVGEESVGTIYFSAEDSHLPMGEESFEFLKQGA